MVAALLAARDGVEQRQSADGAGLALRLAPALAELAAAQEVTGEETPRLRAAKPFGEQGSRCWYVQGALALDFRSASNQTYLTGGGISYFIANDLSLNAELNGLFVHQFGDDALGLNLGLLARFHFLKWERWTVYAELGAGFLGTTADVPGPVAEEPRGGTRFNFTPQAGAGFTYRYQPGLHLMVGVRWFHISNARIWPDNPGRDSLMLYAGVCVPF